MEYIILVGSELGASISQTLGNHAPFFFGVVAPVGLAILWLGSVYALWQTWSGQGGDETGGGGFLLKFIFTLILFALILASGTGLEVLLLGEGHVHARLVGGFLEVFGLS